MKADTYTISNFINIVECKKIRGNFQDRKVFSNCIFRIMKKLLKGIKKFFHFFFFNASFFEGDFVAIFLEL